MRILVVCLMFLALPLRAEVVDLSAHTSLRGAYLITQPDAEFVTVQLVLNVGEADHKGPEGLAHYLEHLVWASADKAHGKGARNRISNAWVNGLFTNYWNASGPEKLGDMLAASAAVFAPLDLTPEYAQTELGIVEREYDLRTLDNPTGQLYIAMHKALLPDHAMARSVIGTPRSLAQITPEKAGAFKDTWYQPGNATLLITGPVTAAEVVPHLEHTLSGLPSRPVPPHAWAAPITWDKRRVTLQLAHRKAAEPVFSTLIKVPMPDGMTRLKTHQTLAMLREVLNSSAKGSPRKALYYDDFILSSIDVHTWTSGGTLNYAYTARADAEVSTEDAIAATRAHFDGLERVNPQSFEQVKTAALAKLKRIGTSPRVETANALDGIIESGAPYDAAAYLAALERVTLDDVNRLLATFQTGGISVTGIVIPEVSK